MKSIKQINAISRKNIFIFCITALVLLILFILTMTVVGSEKNETKKTLARDTIVSNNIEDHIKGNIVTDYTIILNNLYVYDNYLVQEVRTNLSNYAHNHTSETWTSWVDSLNDTIVITSILDNAQTNMNSYIADYFNIDYNSQSSYTEDYNETVSIFNIAKPSIQIDDIITHLRNNLNSTTWYTGIEDYIQTNTSRISTRNSISKNAVTCYLKQKLVKDEFKNYMVKVSVNYRLTLDIYNSYNITESYINSLCQDTITSYDQKLSTILDSMDISSYTSFNDYYINVLSERHNVSTQVYNESKLSLSQKKELKKVFYSDEYKVTVNILFFVVSTIFYIGLALFFIVQFIKENKKDELKINTLFILITMFIMSLVILVSSFIGHAISIHSFSSITLLTLVLYSFITFIVTALISVSIYHVYIKFYNKKDNQ